jgi:hypothetical protein
MLLVVSAALLGACSPPAARPLEGAPVGVGSRPSPVDGARTSFPTLSPPLAPEGGTPSPTTLGSQPSPAALSPTPLPAYVIVATDGAGANLRAGPSTSAPVITTLAEGTLVEVLDDPVSVEGRSWRQIRSGDRQGWVVAVVVRRR